VKYQSTAELKQATADSLVLENGQVRIVDAETFRKRDVDRLVHSAVFGDDDLKAASKWIIWAAAQQLDAKPASIQSLYEAAGKGALLGRTVPAMNLRGMTYDMGRAAIRAALKLNVGALIFEIARSEMGYGNQRPSEYATVILAAALREGFQGPVFIQGDHFQINRKEYGKNPEAQLEGLSQLIDEALAAGFYNIDIDASTLVDLEKATLAEQQELNARHTAEFTKFIREREPQGIAISVGGEIGEVGTQNSTPEELRAFMDAYHEKLGGGVKGISKISVQTGTSHGGVPLPDGTVAKVKLDFERLQELSRIARDEYDLAGAVQHGASTLPEDYFDLFPKMDTAEVHLATGFQNIVFNSSAFPADLKEQAYAYLREKHSDEKKEGQTDEQFYYSSRKRVWGPFKAEFWGLPQSAREQIGKELEDQFAKLYRKLNVVDTIDLVREHVRPVAVDKPAPQGL
jgi:hypothetical protein